MIAICEFATVRQVHCAGCGKKFIPAHGNVRYCSDKCHPKKAAVIAATKRQSRIVVCDHCSKAFHSTRSRSKFCTEECRYQAGLLASRRRHYENGGKPWGSCIRCGRRTRGANCSSCQSLRSTEKHGNYCDYPTLPPVPDNEHETMMDNLLACLGLSDCVDFVFEESSCLRGRGNSLLRSMTCERGGYLSGPRRIHAKRANDKP